MPETVEEAYRLREEAPRKALNFAAREAIGHYHYDDFVKHTGRSAGGEGFYYPKVRRVELLSYDKARLTFWPRWRLWGDQVKPFTMSTWAIANKLEVVYHLSSKESWK